MLIVVANLGFVVDYLSDPNSVGDLWSQYEATLSSTRYLAPIWVLMLVAFGVFYGVALQPRRGNVRVYDRLVIPVAVTSLLYSTALWASGSSYPTLAVMLVLVNLVVAAGTFALATTVSPSLHSRWLRVPFSILFAWMTLTLLVVSMQWLVATDLLADTSSDGVIALTCIVIAVVAAGIVAACYHDPVYPLVMALAMAGVAIAQRSSSLSVAPAALFACLGVLVVAGLAALASMRESSVAANARAGLYALDGQTEYVGAELAVEHAPSSESANEAALIEQDVLPESPIAEAVIDTDANQESPTSVMADVDAVSRTGRRYLIESDPSLMRL
jgi:hypothetical protein